MAEMKSTGTEAATGSVWNADQELALVHLRLLFDVF